MTSWTNAAGERVEHHRPGTQMIFTPARGTRDRNALAAAGIVTIDAPLGPDAADAESGAMYRVTNVANAIPTDAFHDELVPAWGAGPHVVVVADSDLDSGNQVGAEVIGPFPSYDAAAEYAHRQTRYLVEIIPLTTPTTDTPGSPA